MFGEERLEKYDIVNKTKSLEELAEVIKEIAVDGLIEGRVKPHPVENMITCCNHFTIVNNYPSILTRNYGIRQQAYMLYHQGKTKK